MGELAISRAIGDHKLRPFVIAEPEVTRMIRRPDDQMLIMVGPLKARAVNSPQALWPLCLT